jgi:hypothetical protein
MPARTGTPRSARRGSGRDPHSNSRTVFDRNTGGSGNLTCQPDVPARGSRAEGVDETSGTAQELGVPRSAAISGTPSSCSRVLRVNVLPPVAITTSTRGPGATVATGADPRSVTHAPPTGRFSERPPYRDPAHRAAPPGVEVGRERILSDRAPGRDAGEKGALTSSSPRDRPMKRERPHPRE